MKEELRFLNLLLLLLLLLLLIILNFSGLKTKGKGAFKGK
jgi:hypothetical protein